MPNDDLRDAAMRIADALDGEIRGVPTTDQLTALARAYQDVVRGNEADGKRRVLSVLNAVVAISASEARFGIERSSKAETVERIVAVLREAGDWPWAGADVVRDALTPEQAAYFLAVRHGQQWAGAAFIDNWPRWVKDANAAMDKMLRRIAARAATTKEDDRG